ncbi:MAG: TGS domain-containing protein [Candidatus Caldarchaeum sp.]|nr:TGS domain-containing protein [Candidatus Caldarchaeum sp.]
MPTNLPAEAQAALARYQQAKTVEEKIKALEEALPLIPDHKGTEKMRAQLKTTLSKLRRELERKKTMKTSRQDLFTVKKEGAASIVLLGAANSGKSTLLNVLTNAKAEVSGYEMTTRKPVPGIMYVEDVGIQVVELPAVLTSDLKETPFTSRSLAVARTADLIVLTVDCGSNPVNQLEKLVQILGEAGISLGVKNFEVEVEKKDSGGLRLVVFGRFKGTHDSLKNALHRVGIRNAVIKIHGEAGVEDIVEQILRPSLFKKAVVVAGRRDMASEKVLNELKEKAKLLNLPLLEVSAGDPSTLKTFKEEVYRALELVRVYTQKDGVVNRKPVVVSRGTTVGELALLIHREIAKNLRYAKVWGSSVRIQGQQVGPSHVLSDGDLVELFV